MTAVLIILRQAGGFIAKHWQAFAALAGALLIAGIIYGQSVKIDGLKKDIAKQEQVIQFQQETIAAHKAVNEQWIIAADEWEERVAELQGMADSYATVLDQERQKKLAALRKLADVEAELVGQITQPDCVGALEAMLYGLGW